MRDLDGDGDEISSIIPVLADGTAYSGRAWLREIEVTNWGDADELMLVPHGGDAVMTGDLINNASVIRLTTVNDSDTFAVGEVTMGTQFLIDEIPPGKTLQLPEFTASWSCRYASKLSNLGITGLDYDHRLITRNFPSIDTTSIELQGRHERLYVPMTESGGVYSFNYHSRLHGGVTLVGSATLVGSNIVVTLSSTKVNGVNFGSRVFTFSPLSE